MKHGCRRSGSSSNGRGSNGRLQAPPWLGLGCGYTGFWPLCKMPLTDTAGRSYPGSWVSHLTNSPGTERAVDGSLEIAAVNAECSGETRTIFTSKLPGDSDSWRTQIIWADCTQSTAWGANKQPRRPQAASSYHRSPVLLHFSPYAHFGASLS